MPTSNRSDLPRPIFHKIRSANSDDEVSSSCGSVRIDRLDLTRADRKGASRCADEVTLARKGAKSRTRITGLRSTRTKASERVHPIREPQLEERLAEALEQQAAMAEVLSIISTSPTKLQPVLDVVVKSAARFCGAKDATILESNGPNLGLPPPSAPLPP